MTLHTMTMQSQPAPEIVQQLAATIGSTGPTGKNRQSAADGKKTDKSGELRKSADHFVSRGIDSELREELRKLLGHLHAQAMLISGEGMENFCNHNDEIKSDYLWAMCDTAERAMKLIDDAC